MSSHPRHNVAFHHEAFLYRDPETFLRYTVDFVTSGREAGEPVMVALASDKLAALTRELGPGARDVAMVDMADLGANPARIIPAWRRFLRERATGGPVRGIGEPIWAGRSPTELVECQLHEALLNVAFEDDTGFFLMCPYDEIALDPQVLDEALRSHSFVTDGGTARRSETFQGNSWFATFLDGPLSSPTTPVQEIIFARRDLQSVRQFVLRVATTAGLGDRSGDVALAVHEVAVNSVRHGGGHGSLKTWQVGPLLTFEISDVGHIADPLVGRVDPHPGVSHGRGLWLANQICDLVQIRTSELGTTVRLQVGRAPPR